MKANIFGYLDYRAYIRYQIESHSGVYGYKAQLAEAAGCQRSFLSQVLSERAHLIPEHAVGLSELWELSAIESDYFMNLVLFARAGTKKLRDHLKSKIDNAKRDQENLVKRIAEKIVIPEASAAVFYSSWQFLAINILLTIPSYRTIPSLAHRLHLSEDVVKKTLHQLEELGLVAKSGSQWLATNSTIHLPRDSQFNSLNHSHWRNKAVEDSFLVRPESVHYTSVCSISLEDAKKIKDLTLQLIDESRKVVAPSKEEELFCLTVDWFKI